MKASATTPPMDFFNRIVVKARGAESSIAPRLPALFEPVAGVELAPTTAIEEELATSVAARALQEPQPASVPPRGPGMHELHPLAPRPVETAGQGDEPVPAEPDRQARAAEAAPVASLQPLPVVIAGVVASAATRPGEQQPDYKPAPGAMRTAKTVPRRTRESARDVSGPGPNDLHQESGTLIPKPAAVPVPYPAAREAPRADAATAARDFTANTPMTEQSAPVINVTIGRVEVRAVQPPAGKPRSEPSRPKPLSLDDYLKQRGGNR